MYLANKILKIEDRYYWGYGEVGLGSADMVLKFANDWHAKDSATLARIRIAVALLLNSSTDVQDREKAAELYNLNLEPNNDTPGPEKFNSYVGLADFFKTPISDTESQEERAIRWGDVIKYCDLALEQLEEERGALGSELDNQRCTTAFWLKADFERKRGNTSIALDTCKKALAPHMLEHTDELLDFLTMIVDIHGEEGEHTKIIRAVIECPFDMKVKWLWLRSDNFTGKSDSLRKAAVLTRRVDSLIQLYDASIIHWQRRNWWKAQILAVELAVIYRCDARATKMAEVLLGKILENVKEKLSESSSTASNVIQFAFPEMADVLAEKFSVAWDQASKTAVARQLDEMIAYFAPKGVVSTMKVAEARLTLAKLWRGLGNFQKARLEADKAFDSCVEELQDTDTSNDHDALRIFGKVLMFLKLEVDAGIALSLQNSDVSARSIESDSSSHFSGAEPLATDENNGSVKDDTPVEPPTQLIGNSPNTEKNQNLNIITNGVKGSKAVAVDSDITVTDVQTQSNPTLSPEKENIRIQDAHSTEAKEESATLSTNEDGSLVQPVVDERVQAAVAPAQAVSDKKVVAEWPQDLIPEESWNLQCNGPCPATEKQVLNTQLYTCLDCYEVDLCAVCYKEQMKFFDLEEMGEGFWFKCCWAKHEFITWPIEEWHGTKDGVIRISIKQKLFSSWLEAVKKKWKRELKNLS
jgi:hypothetical protein